MTVYLEDQLSSNEADVPGGSRFVYVLWTVRPLSLEDLPTNVLCTLRDLFDTPKRALHACRFSAFYWDLNQGGNPVHLYSVVALTVAV